MFVEGGNALDAVGDVELARDKAGDGFGLEGPEAVCSGVGDGIDDASGEREEAVGREVVFASGGKPEEFGVCEGVNEGGFLAFDDSYRFERIGREEVFSEKALTEAEIVRELTLRHEDAVEPVE